MVKVLRFKKELGFTTSPERSKHMGRLRGSDTKSEVLFRKILWSKGIRYRKNFGQLKGKPDIVITNPKIVIFIDGEFWHGFKWAEKKEKIKTNREFWIPKIERNIERDKETNSTLETLGYKIFRFWSHQVEKETQECVRYITDYIELNK